MFGDDNVQNYYEVLDVKPDATQHEIRQAYFRAKAAYAKDSAATYSLFDHQQARRVIESIEQAYLVLSSPEKRREYDKVHGLLSQEPSGLPAGGSRAGVFSFAAGAIRNSETVEENAAHDAARTVFGASSSEEDSFFDNASTARESLGGSPDKLASASALTPSASSTPPSAPPPFLHREAERASEDYATPRTLASHDAAGPPAQDYSSSFSVSDSPRSHVGVRRVTLDKIYAKDPSVEDSIVSEASFRGTFLKRVREYRGISVEELSDFTKISRTYINCLESEEFESLPAAAYVRGFVVQIAKALKLPSDKVAMGYMTHYKNTVLK